MNNPLNLNVDFDKFEGDSNAYRMAAEDAFDDEAAWNVIGKYFKGESFAETQKKLINLIDAATDKASEVTGYNGQYCGGASASIYSSMFGYKLIMLYGGEEEFVNSLKNAGIDAEDFE